MRVDFEETKIHVTHEQHGFQPSKTNLKTVSKHFNRNKEKNSSELVGILIQVIIVVHLFGPKQLLL